MEPENTPLEREKHLIQTMIFRFKLLIFRGDVSFSKATTGFSPRPKNPCRDQLLFELDDEGCFFEMMFFVRIFNVCMSD